MGLFQTSVAKRELEKQDKSVVEKAYKRFKKYFFNSTIQQNIRESKEEQFQEGFLRELFVTVFGYTINPNPNYNLTTEYKNQSGAKKADAAILVKGDALAVIELKSTKTKDLEKIRQQAFDYKSHQPTCVYVITSNFERLRFYINNSVDYEEFDLFTISPERFKLLYFCLAKENLTENIPLQTKEASVIEEEQITKKLYADYSLFKREIFRDIVKRNMNNPTLRELTEKDIKKTLFKKTQKLLDRFLFIFFAEDRGLLPPNSISQIIEKWQDDVDFGEDKTLYTIYKSYFHVLNIGRPKQGKRQEIFAYNGGLFKPDAILDALDISNDLLLKHTSKLTKYDFETDVDVNILGHIFENSLNEIESINAEIEGVEFDKQKTKRKKDGVFYTPKYITKYIVDNTLGKLCEEKKKELDINDDVYLYAKQRSKKRIDKLEEYRKWLLQLTICDPACGSGAFLNQALDFLIKEHAYIDELTAKYHNVPLVLSDIENSILENNIYGVDLNEESVEIAKLSLWLRTAQKGRKLTSLSSNIKCGNSLIDSKAVAGDKAFDWEKEFPQIFNTKETKLTKKEVEEFEKLPDYLELIEQNAKLAQEKAEQSVKLSQEAIMYSKKVYELTQKQKSIVSEAGEFYGINKGGFDVVIGNPPYVNANELKKNLTKSEYNFLKSSYKTAKGTVDLYIYFFEKGIEILRKNGILSFITPNRFLSASYGRALREFLISKYKITSLIDYSDKNVFPDVSTYPVISFIENKKVDKYSILTGSFDNITKQIIKKSFSSEKLTILDDYILGFLLNDKLSITEKVINQSESLKNTGKINATSTAKEADEYSQLIQENIEGYKLINTGTIDPFCNMWGKEKLTDKGRKILKPLLPNTSKTISKNRHSLYSSSKIIISKIGLQCEAFYDIKGEFASINTNCIHTFNDNYLPEYLLCWLNSNLYNYTFECFFDGLRMSGGYLLYSAPNLKNSYIKNIPISNQKPFIELSKKMTFSIDCINTASLKFTNYLQSNYKIEKLSKKLQNWHELEFVDFIKELNKAIKKGGGEKLNKTDEFEWMELFGNKKAEAQKLKAEIDKTNKEIDQMVYELYGLTEEEIEIVENT